VTKTLGDDDDLISLWNLDSALLATVQDDRYSTDGNARLSLISNMTWLNSQHFHEVKQISQHPGSDSDSFDDWVFTLRCSLFLVVACSTVVSTLVSRTILNHRCVLILQSFYVDQKSRFLFCIDNNRSSCSIDPLRCSSTYLGFEPLCHRLIDLFVLLNRHKVTCSDAHVCQVLAELLHRGC